MSKQAVITTCPHEGCEERHLLRPGDFRIVRGSAGEVPKGNFKTVKRPAVDRRFSDAIRKRDGRCIKCGSEQNLQAAHYISRRYKTLFKGFDKHTGWNCCLKHTETNACALCPGCHDFVDSHPSEKDAFFRGLIGDEEADRLQGLKPTSKIVPRPEVQSSKEAQT